MLQKIFLFLFVILVFIGAILELNNLLNGVPKDKAIAVGYFSAILYTFLFGFVLQKPLKKLFSGFSTIASFTIIGTIGSIFIETVIWAAQEILHTTGAAISPILFLDLIMTVPFYSLLSYLFSKQLSKSNFTWQAVAIAGGCYEIVADGVIGNLVQLNLLGALISPILLPIFVVVYSPIILAPFLIISKNEASINNKYTLLIKPALAALIFPFSLGLGFLLGQIIK